MSQRSQIETVLRDVGWLRLTLVGIMLLSVIFIPFVGLGLLLGASPFEAFGIATAILGACGLVALIWWKVR